MGGTFWIGYANGTAAITWLLPVPVTTSSENPGSGRPPVYRRSRAYRLKPNLQREPTASTTPSCVSGSLPPRRADSHPLVFVLESNFVPISFFTDQSLPLNLTLNSLISCPSASIPIPSPLPSLVLPICVFTCPFVHLTQADAVVESWDLEKHGKRDVTAEVKLWCSRVFQAPLLLEHNWGESG